MIVLAHGIARFDALLADAGVTGVYFKGIAKHLREAELEVVETNVAFADSVDVRSRELAAQIVRIGGPVHIIAHSMGGLDARHMIVGHADAAGRVRSLTTIGTPHNGTSFADYGLAHGNKVVDIVKSVSRLSLEGFRDLTTTACRAFNDAARDAESQNHVKYRVVSASEDRAAVFGLLKRSYDIIKEAEGGENDGLVSVASQRWTGHGLQKPVAVIPFPVPADHLNEIGWWDPEEIAALRFSPVHYTDQIKAFYLDLARRAVAEG